MEKEDKKANSETEAEVFSSKENSSQPNAKGAAKKVSPSSAPKDLEKADLAATQSAIEEKFIRLQADFDNYKKRMAKEEVTWIKRANERLLKTLIPIFNDFDRALSIKNQKNPQEIIKGVQLTYAKLEKKLAQEGVQAIKVKVGDLPKEEDTEAISVVDVEDVNQQGKIIEVVEKGYQWHGVTLYRAKIIVGKS